MISRFFKIIVSGTLLFFLFLPLSLSAQQKRALVIGLGEQEDKTWNKINGDRDVVLVNDILTKSGFEDITQLVNSHATKKNIINSFKSLITRCGKGDVVYIHFSGHGQQMDDFNGDETDDLDECWIPYDAYVKCCKRDNGNRHITDDEINIILHKIKDKIGNNGRILVVVDACHSGDSSRGNDEDIYRGTYDRFYAESESVNLDINTDSEQWIILSACRDYQRNAELKTKDGQYGKLTYALYTLLKSKRKRTNTQLYTEICRFFNNNRGTLQQTPDMKGVTNKFSITDIF